MKLPLLVLATIVTFSPQFVGNQRVITGEAPRGNVSLQWARTAGRADSILQSWSKRQLLRPAKRHICADFLFIAAYVGLLVTLARRGSNVAPRVAWAAVLLAIAAGVLDALENLGMLELIKAYGAPGSARSSGTMTFGVYLCSMAKFTLLAACLAVLLYIDVRRVNVPKNARMAA